MKITPKKALPALLCLLILAAAGCSAGQNGAGSPSPSPAASSGPVSSPAEAPSTSPTASASDNASVLPLPVDPPPASAEPASYPSRTGKVTAVRLADPMTGWAGGEGWLAGTTDGGRHWNIQLRHQYVVGQIFALNAKEAWATLDIGDKRGMKLVRTTDGGKHWKDAGVTPSYAFFHFVSDKEAFCGNARTTDGGKTWTALPAPGNTVGEAYYHDAANGWAVTNGSQGFSIRRTTDGGKTWPTVLSRKSEGQPTYALIRSTGKADAWVEIVGDSGMSQTSYSLFHTADGGKHWQPVLANSGAGSGPAPGFAADEDQVPKSAGSSPGTLYVVNPATAFMGAQCRACDLPNTIGKTTDGGKSWVNLKGQYPGYGEQQIAAADAKHVWWINTDGAEPSKMYTTSDGGAHWTLVHTFDKPK